MSNEKGKDDIFALAKERRDKRRSRKQHSRINAIRECSYEGCDITSEDMDLEEYYGKPYCPTHLHLKKKEMAKKREKKKGKRIDLTEVITRLDNQQASINEIVKGFRYMAKRSFLINEGTILLSILEDPKHHALRSRLVSKFSMADETSIDRVLERMYKQDEVINRDGVNVGKLLWKNKHGWYIVNPNLPKDAFEKLIEESISYEEYYTFIKTQVNRQNHAVKRKKDDEMYYQYTGVDVATYGDRRQSRIFPVRQEVRDKIKWIEAKVAREHKKIKVLP